MIDSKTLFKIHKAISDSSAGVSRQTNLGPRDITTSKNYFNNLPERNISLAEITRALSLGRGSTGSGVVEVDGIKYLLTEAGIFMLNEEGKIIEGEGLFF